MQYRHGQTYRSDQSRGRGVDRHGAVAPRTSSAADFSLKEIEARLVGEGLTDNERPGVYPHLSVHCVANRPPNPGTYRMLFETAPSRRRLFRPGDPYNPKREGEKWCRTAPRFPRNITRCWTGTS